MFTFHILHDFSRTSTLDFWNYELIRFESHSKKWHLYVLFCEIDFIFLANEKSSYYVRFFRSHGSVSCVPIFTDNYTTKISVFPMWFPSFYGGYWVYSDWIPIFYEENVRSNFYIISKKISIFSHLWYKLLTDYIQ